MSGLIVFLVSHDGCVALPHGAMGLSAVCDCHTHYFLALRLTIFMIVIFCNLFVCLSKRQAKNIPPRYLIVYSAI